jgi:2-keto-4-pentenoate hydratase/2-oxohepta-3-ene-1,7-dioic acid hydratase in catechol pathway
MPTMREAGLAPPEEPVLFLKAASALCGPEDDLLPPQAHKVDWEVELGLVIGQRMQHVPEWRAMEHLAGLCAGQRYLRRAWQMERGGQWDRASPGGFAVGPWLVTPDEVEDPHNPWRCGWSSTGW